MPPTIPLIARIHGAERAPSGLSPQDVAELLDASRIELNGALPTAELHARAVLVYVRYYLHEGPEGIRKACEVLEEPAGLPHFQATRAERQMFLLHHLRYNRVLSHLLRDRPNSWMYTTAQETGDYFSACHRPDLAARAYLLAAVVGRRLRVADTVLANKLSRGGYNFPDDPRLRTLMRWAVRKGTGRFHRLYYEGGLCPTRADLAPADFMPYLGHNS